MKVYVTAVVPTTKNAPGACVLSVSETTPELSVAVGSVHVTVVPPTPVATVSVMSPIQAITGATVSTVNTRLMKSNLMLTLQGEVDQIGHLQMLNNFPHPRVLGSCWGSCTINKTTFSATRMC